MNEELEKELLFFKEVYPPGSITQELLRQKLQSIDADYQRIVLDDLDFCCKLIQVMLYADIALQIEFVKDEVLYKYIVNDWFYLFASRIMEIRHQKSCEAQSKTDQAIHDLFAYARKHLYSDNGKIFEILGKVLDVKKYYYYHFTDSSSSYKEFLISQPLNDIDQNWRQELKPGDFLDFLKTEPRHDRKGWMRGKVISNDGKYIQFDHLLDDDNSQKITQKKSEGTVPINSKEIQFPGKMTADWDWRSNIQVGDLVDCLDIQKYWYYSTVVQIDGSKQKATIGYRVYTEEVPEKGSTQYKYDPSFKQYYKGWQEKFDNPLFLNNPRLQQPNTFSGGLTSKSGKNRGYERQDNQLVHLFQDGIMYFTPRETYGAAFIFKLLNSNTGKEFFDQILEPLEADKVVSPDFVSELLNFISGISKFMVKDYSIKFHQNLKRVIQQYILSIPDNHFRGPMKDKIQRIINTNIQLLKEFSDSRNDNVGQDFRFQNQFSILNICSDVFDRKLIGLRAFSEAITLAKKKEHRSELIQSIIDCKIFEKLIMTRQHQFIERSQEFLQFMAETDALTIPEIQIILDIIQKGENEEKVQMMKIFKEILKFFQQQQKDFILDQITKGDDTKKVEKDILQMMFELAKGEETMTKKIINKCWDIVENQFLHSKEIFELSASKLIELFKDKDMKSMYQEIFIKCLANLSAIILAIHDNIGDSYSYYTDSWTKHKIWEFLDTDNQISEIIINNLQATREFILNQIKEKKLEDKPLTLELIETACFQGRYAFIDHIEEKLRFIHKRKLNLYVQWKY